MEMCTYNDNQQQIDNKHTLHKDIEAHTELISLQLSDSTKECE